MWIAGRDFLEQSGYAQYEVSNFSVVQTCDMQTTLNQSLHNICYWRMENWIGAGASASGTIIDDETGTGKRITFAQSVTDFIKSPQPSIEQIDKTTLLKDSLMMGFRYLEGPNEQLFQKRFGVSISDVIPQTIQTYQKMDYMQTKKTALTKTGLLFLNAFIRSCFAEVDFFFNKQ
jgi:oxygen-independent coproporphyrinogen-3 oxidase